MTVYVGVDGAGLGVGVATESPFILVEDSGANSISGPSVEPAALAFSNVLFCSRVFRLKEPPRKGPFQ